MMSLKMVRDYNKKYIPLDISGEIYETEDNEAYFIITMLAPKESKAVIENGTMKVVTEGFNETSQYPVEEGLIDAKTGKISKKSSSGKVLKKLKRSQNRDLRIDIHSLLCQKRDYLVPEEMTTFLEDYNLGLIKVLGKLKGTKYL